MCDNSFLQVGNQNLGKMVRIHLFRALEMNQKPDTRKAAQGQEKGSMIGRTAHLVVFYLIQSPSIVLQH
jgi:hypothetical protein